MIKKRNYFEVKNKQDNQVTENSFTQAVKNAGSGEKTPNHKDSGSERLQAGNAVSLKAHDELMRAKEAKNDATTESEKFRREE